MLIKKYAWMAGIILVFSSCSTEDLPERHLLSNQPANFFEEAYPLGNGRIGAMIYGGIDVDRISINEETLWAGGPVDPYMNPDAYKHLPGVREALFNENYRLADEKVRKLQGSYSQSYAPLGEIRIEYADTSPVSSYQRILDLREGVATVKYQHGQGQVKREYFISHPDQLLVMQISSSQTLPLMRLSPESKLPFSISAGNNEIIMDGLAPSHAEPNYRGDIPDALKYDEEESMRFRLTAKVADTDGKLIIEDGSLLLSDARKATILISVATSFKSFDKNPGLEGVDEKAKCEEILLHSERFTYDQLKDRHTRDFSSLFNRVSLEIGKSLPENSLTTLQRLKNYQQGMEDPDLVALYFQFGRYLLISSSRPGGIPANLQGIWNEHLRPPWSSNYTTNINAEMNYWPAEVCNLSELHGPLLDHIARIAETGAVTARTFYACEGWCCHHNTDIWAMSNPVGDFGRGHPIWANWNMGGAWLTSHLWEHFLYSRDTAYLIDYAYPLMKGAAVFCQDFLVPAPDGYLVTAPSTSPENLYITDEGYTGGCLYGSTADIAMIMELFNNMVEASAITGDDSMRSVVLSTLDKLPPYRIGSKGNLQEWYYDWEDQDPKHRHLSHLFGLYPGHSISPDIDPEIFKACRRSLELRTNNGTGWSIAWKIALWARMLDGEMALNAINKLLFPVLMEENAGSNGGGTYPNLFDAHPPFQIDGNFGGTAGIAEMLLQSKVDEITLLPALPVQWPDGKVKGLRARGGYSVDISWESGQVTEACIMPNHNGIFRVKDGEESMEFKGIKGKKVIYRP